MEYKMPAAMSTAPGQIRAPESNDIMEDEWKIKIEPEVKQRTIGRKSQAAIWHSLFFCTTGFVSIPSTRLNVSDS
jgi:hypothetical protein